MVDVMIYCKFLVLSTTPRTYLYIPANRAHILFREREKLCPSFSVVRVSLYYVVKQTGSLSTTRYGATAF